jgi:hypothetical protein
VKSCYDTVDASKRRKRPTIQPKRQSCGSLAISSLIELINHLTSVTAKQSTSVAASPTAGAAETTTGRGSAGKGGKKQNGKKEATTALPSMSVNPIIPILIAVVRLGAFGFVLHVGRPLAINFHNAGHEMAKAISHPTIVLKQHTRRCSDIISAMVRDKPRGHPEFALNWNIRNKIEFSNRCIFRKMEFNKFQRLEYDLYGMEIIFIA